MLKPSPQFIICIQPFRQIHLSTLHLKKAIFKPKIARTKPVKTPSNLALDNFDFYYGPLFGEQWPSIRLGLLTPNKFVAVLNRFSTDFEVNESILQSMGTKNIMDYLIAGKDLSDTKIESKKNKVLKKPLRDIEGDVWSEEEVYGNKVEEASKGQDEEGSENVDTRLEGGLYEFKQPSETYTMGKLNLPAVKTPKKKSLDTIEVTGVERFHGNLLQKEDFLVYPRSLRLYCYSKGSLSDFPAPLKDKKDISILKKPLRDIEGDVWSMGIKVTGVERFQVLKKANFLVYPRSFRLYCFLKGRLSDFPAIIKDKKYISSWWLLDVGSIFPVQALDLQAGDNVLNICSAPGRKSLLIAQTELFDKLICTDVKFSRIEEASKIIIKRHDFSIFWLLMLFDHLKLVVQWFVQRVHFYQCKMIAENADVIAEQEFGIKCIE
uniref:SAM-dependent MTase RsmB/NOP-type domain-containing protein n=1 Tax=Panagrolaimus sp. PS1159 TaxID=55785 RepID=A0AC35GVV7_9BILA